MPAGLQVTEVPRIEALTGKSETTAPTMTRAAPSNPITRLATAISADHR